VVKFTFVPHRRWKKRGMSRRTLHRKINEMNAAKAQAESASEKTH
jgi:hypothetical protein